MTLRSAADPPSPSSLRWVSAAAGGAPVVRWRRLTGGVATSTHLLVLADGRQVVLRRFRPEWLAEEPAQVAREAATLGHVAASGLPVPALVAVDADGAASGRASLLMRRLPGRIDLTPRDLGAWLQQQAEALAAIHALAPPAGARPRPSRAHRRDRRPPAWSAHPERWQEALDVVAGGHPDGDRFLRTFGHGDFQHFNLLWARGRLSGIVDWGADTLRAPDRDVGHCRLNVAILLGTDAAEDLRRRYEVAAGREVDPWWDLLETVAFLPTWSDTILRQVGRRRPIDADGMHRRVDAHLLTLLRRLGR